MPLTLEMLSCSTFSSVGSFSCPALWLNKFCQLRTTTITHIYDKTKVDLIFPATTADDLQTLLSPEIDCFKM